MTQLLMITSTQSPGSGCLDLALEELDVGRRRPSAVLTREREHLVGHVEPVGLAGGADAAGGQQHVDPAAAAEVEHDLAGLQVGERRGVAAAEAGEHGRRRGGRPSRRRRRGRGRARPGLDGAAAAAAAAAAGPRPRLAATARSASGRGFALEFLRRWSRSSRAPLGRSPNQLLLVYSIGGSPAAVNTKSKISGGRLRAHGEDEAPEAASADPPGTPLHATAEAPSCDSRESPRRWPTRSASACWTS